MKIKDMKKLMKLFADTDEFDEHDVEVSLSVLRDDGSFMTTTVADAKWSLNEEVLRMIPEQGLCETPDIGWKAGEKTPVIYKMWRVKMKSGETFHFDTHDDLASWVSGWDDDQSIESIKPVKYQEVA